MENEQNKPMQTPAPYAAGTGSVPVALDRDALRDGILAPSQREARKRPLPYKSKNTKKEKLYV